MLPGWYLSLHLDPWPLKASPSWTPASKYEAHTLTYEGRLLVATHQGRRAFIRNCVDRLLCLAVGHCMSNLCLAGSWSC